MASFDIAYLILESGKQNDLPLNTNLDAIPWATNDVVRATDIIQRARNRQ
jgi:hypothetical protein